MQVYKAPEEIESFDCPSVFLAGSIEMGKAMDWQTQLTQSLKDLDVVVFNPRRDDWDSTWNQSIEDKNFSEQVNWELNMLDRCDIIAMYFDPSTKSPISLLELGLYSDTGKLIVCCPDGFWRKGNVDIVCQKYGIHNVSNIESLISATRFEINKLGD